jgi:hypothetical protein
MISILCCAIGLILVLNFEKHTHFHPVRIVIGLGIAAGGTLIGIRATTNMYAKILGVNPYRNTKFDDDDRGSCNPCGMTYINIATIILSLLHLSAPFFNAMLLRKYGAYTVFAFSGLLFILALLLVGCSRNHLKSHHSYLICKQLETFRNMG